MSNTQIPECSMQFYVILPYNETLEIITFKIWKISWVGHYTGDYKEVLKHFQPDNETLQKKHFFYFDMGHSLNFSAAPQIWCEIHHIPPIPFITLTIFFCGFYWVS